MGAISADINSNASDGRPRPAGQRDRERDFPSPLQREREDAEWAEWTLDMGYLIGAACGPRAVARVEPAPPVTTPINLVGREGERD